MKNTYTVEDALREPWLPVMRELVRTYQAFARRSGRHIKELDLTPPQFDVIATLGNTDGMTFKELGERTLITKGSLTGIIDRLEEKGLVRRVTSAADRRSIVAQLTRKGEQVFESVFPVHVRYMTEAFERLSGRQQRDLVRLLGKLKQAL